jgi:tRNA(Met) C34 N-acetyltransferase TmcA
VTDLAMVEAARRDPAVFARVLIGEELWPHQLEVVASGARYRVICAGRRSGKTRVFGVLSLHKAFAQPRAKVLIVSAGDVASKRMFADIALMAAGAPLLAGSVADETKSLLTLSTGSTIECVPASMAQVRSAEADLLIVDEAGFVAQGIWEAAEPVVIARPRSRVLIC